MSKRSRRAGGHLTPEDHKLWELVAKRVRPLADAAHKKPKLQQHGAEQRPASSPSGERSPPADLAAASQANAFVADRTSTKAAMPARPQSTSTSGAAVPSSSSARRVQRHPTTLDANTVRAISRRHGAIDGRIDLHGMTQAEAHAALRGFLTRAHRQGHRTVLVITGKGLTLADEQAGPWWDATHPARGVLRRSLPGWLAAPDLAPIVVGYAEAHDRHGGGGAFYVRLRLMGPVVRR